MFAFVMQHQSWAAVLICWVFSAAVSSFLEASPWRACASRPEPAADSAGGYLWLYRFCHTTAGNLTTVFGSKIPGLKTVAVVLMIPLLLSITACAAHYTNRYVNGHWPLVIC
jgi:hypothetical protein